MNGPVVVLHVLGELRPSGAEVMLLEAVPVMRDLGVESIVVSTGEEIGDFAAEFRTLGVPAFHVPFGRNLSFAMRMLRLLISLRPDVVHVHTERANAAICAIARLCGARVVRTIHSVFPYRGGLRSRRMIERAALRFIGVRQVSVSRAVQENEATHLGNRTTLIDNWIGDRYRPPTSHERSVARARLEIAEQHFVVVSVGACSPVKNHQAILHALPGIARAVGGEVVYLHVGSGSDEAEERQTVRHLDGPLDVRFLGSVRDVRPFLWASDVFCMPSKYEGLGVSALEAAACATPMVLSDVSGMRDVHEAGPAVRFESPTAQGVLRGVLGLLSVDRDDLDAARASMADDVRSSRSCVPAVGKLTSLYQNGAGQAGLNGRR